MGASQFFQRVKIPSLPKSYKIPKRKMSANASAQGQGVAPQGQVVQNPAQAAAQPVQGHVYQQLPYYGNLPQYQQYAPPPQQVHEISYPP